MTSRAQLEALTVQGLIDALNEVEDRSRLVYMSGCDCYTTAAYVQVPDTGQVTVMNVEYDDPPRYVPPLHRSPQPTPDKPAPPLPNHLTHGNELPFGYPGPTYDDSPTYAPPFDDRPMANDDGEWNLEPRDWDEN